MLIGELLSRQERFAAYGPQAVVDTWMTLVVPHTVARDYQPTPAPAPGRTRTRSRRRNILMF